MSNHESFYDRAIQLASKMTVSERQEFIYDLGKMNTTKYEGHHFESTIQVLMDKIKRQKGHTATSNGSRYGGDHNGYASTPIENNVKVTIKHSQGSKKSSEYTIGIEARSQPFAGQDANKEVVYFLVCVMGENYDRPTEECEILVSNFSGKPKDISEWVASIIYTMFIRRRDVDRATYLMKNNLYEVEMT